MEKGPTAIMLCFVDIFIQVNRAVLKKIHENCDKNIQPLFRKNAINKLQC